jgi:hypothetical protein
VPPRSHRPNRRRGRRWRDLRLILAAPADRGYDFNDDLLPIGASYLAGLVEQELG